MLFHLFLDIFFLFEINVEAFQKYHKRLQSQQNLMQFLYGVNLIAVYLNSHDDVLINILTLWTSGNYLKSSLSIKSICWITWFPSTYKWTYISNPAELFKCLSYWLYSPILLYFSLKINPVIFLLSQISIWQTEKLSIQLRKKPNFHSNSEQQESFCDTALFNCHFYSIQFSDNCFIWKH